jgi:hypothetical protein
MWFDWITDKASARSLLIPCPDGMVLAFVVTPFEERSAPGFPVRRADRVCWAIISAGIARAKMRNRIPGAKELFLTQPS